MKSRENTIWKWSAHSILAIISLLALLPFLLLIISSFTDNASAVRNGYSFFPQKWSLEAYRYMANDWSTIGRAYMITILVTILGTGISLLITSMLAYTLSIKDLPGGRVLSFLVVFTMLFSGGIVPTYMVYTKMLNITNSIWALIIPGLLMNAFTIMLVKNYFMFSIPPALAESAKIDGASELRTFFSIILPLSLPILATIGLMSGIAYWNDWQNGLYYLTDTKLYSIQLLLNRINKDIAFIASNSTVVTNTANLPTTTVRMAIAVIGILPILVIYPFFQKYFVKGITIGSVKE